MRRIELIILALFLIVVLWGEFFSKTALSQAIDARVGRLETQVQNLESRINQIESQLGSSRQSPSTRVPVNPSLPRSRGNVSPQERDRMFDRLATLVIETRQDVNALQARVAKLEKRR
jgi:BMFP domain-containing protein YqiC